MRGKISAADIANAALAGGVTIGSTCDIAGALVSFVIGVLAGAVSTFGFAILQSKVEGMNKGIDTCGVMNLHGIPGLMGGLAAILVAKGINTGAQLTGIGVTVLVGLVAGFVAGKLISLLGRRAVAYDDAEEFEL